VQNKLSSWEREQEIEAHSSFSRFEKWLSIYGWVLKRLPNKNIMPGEQGAGSRGRKVVLIPELVNLFFGVP
jgi:hypothetical protein